MVAKVHGAFVGRTPGFAVAGRGAQRRDGARRRRVAASRPGAAGHPPARHVRDRGAAPAAGAAARRDVLVISAAKEAEAVRTALRGGVVNYLLKPFDQDALRDRLQRTRPTHRSLAEPTVAQTDLDRLSAAAPPPGGARLPKGLSPESADLVAGVLRTTDDDLSARSAPSAPGCPGSAPAATWSTSSRSAGRRCGCSTGRRAGRSAATPGGRRVPALTGRGRRGASPDPPLRVPGQ